MKLPDFSLSHDHKAEAALALHVLPTPLLPQPPVSRQIKGTAWLGSPIACHPQPQPSGGKGLSGEESPAGLEPRFNPQAAGPRTQLPAGGGLEGGSDPHQVPENHCPQQSPVPDTVAREGLSYGYGGAGAARAGAATPISRAATPIPPLGRIPPRGTGAQHLRAQQSEAPEQPAQRSALPAPARDRSEMLTGQERHRQSCLNIYFSSPKLLLPPCLIPFHPHTRSLFQGLMLERGHQDGCK